MKELKNWEKATQELADLFVKKYHPESFEYVWDSNEIGRNIIVDELYCWSVSHMVDALRMNIPQEKLFQWHNLALKAFEKGQKFQSLRLFIQSKD